MKTIITPDSTQQLIEWTDKLRKVNAEFQTTTRKGKTVIIIDHVHARDILGIEPQKLKMPVTFYLFVIVVIGLIALVYFGEKTETSHKKPAEQQYSKYWREPGAELGPIAITLKKSGAEGCGEFYVRQNGDNEWLVACTSDRQTWTYYRVWPNIGKATTISDPMTPPQFLQ